MSKEREAFLDNWLGRADLPTYVGGWLAAMAWLAVVGATIGNVSFNLFIYLMTTIGYLLSFWVRGFRGTPQWQVIQQRVLQPSVTFRLVFMVCCVLPALLGMKAFAALIPEEASGVEEWLIGTGYMWAMALYSFGLVSDGLVAFGSVLGVSMLGLMAITNVNPELGIAFLVFLLGNVLMLSNTTLAHHSGRRRPMSARGVARWFGDQVIVAGLIVSLTAVASIGVGWVLQKVAPEGLVPRLSLSGGFPSQLSATGYAGFGDVMLLGTGEALADTPVIKAESDGPSTWRRRVYDQYTGHSWRGRRRGESIVPVRQNQRVIDIHWNRRVVDQLKACRPVNQRLTYLLDADWVGVPVVTELEVTGGEYLELVQLDSYQNLLLPLAKGTVIRQVSQHPEPTPDELRAAPPGEARSMLWMLHVPPSAANAIAPVARQLKQGQANGYDTAVAIQQYLEQNFIYDASARVPRAADDSMTWYFQAKRGACDLISTAMVLLSRSCGIPARIAVGFAEGEVQPDGSHLLRIRDAHAWAELFFQGYGWIKFDPAVPLDNPAVDTSTAEPLLSSLLRFDRRTPWLLLVVILGAWLGGYITLELRQARPTFDRDPVGQITASYYRAQRALARCGWERRRYETAAEHAARLAAEQPVAAWLVPLGELVAWFERARYRFTALTDEDAARAQGAEAALKRMVSRPPREGGG